MKEFIELLKLLAIVVLLFIVLSINQHGVQVNY